MKCVLWIKYPTFTVRAPCPDTFDFNIKPFVLNKISTYVTDINFEKQFRSLKGYTVRCCKFKQR